MPIVEQPHAGAALSILPRHPVSPMTAHEDKQADKYAAFRNPSFLRFWLARFLTTFAAQVIAVAVGWQVYDLTRDPLDLGLIGLVQFAPALALVLVTGAAADRFGRRTIMSVTILMEAGVALFLLYMTFRGLTSPLPVFAALLFFGVARAFFAPASTSLVANLVPPELFANAVAWNSSAWQTATIVGPVAGGLLYGAGASVPYAVAVGLLALAAVLIMSIPKPAQRTLPEKVNLQSVFAGFSYIWSEKVVLGAVSLDLFAVLLGGAVALLPVYARDILELGPWGLGLLRAAPGIGAIGVAVWLAGHPLRDHAGIILFVFVFLFGLFTAVFAVSTLVVVSVLAMIMIGATDMVSVYIRETLIQLWTPDRVRGRVNAVNMVFVGASNELGEFRAGTMAAMIGTVPAVLFGGIGAMGVAVLWAFMFPALRKARHLEGRS